LVELRVMPRVEAPHAGFQLAASRFAGHEGS
jgi:hypothetical protein